ncbi:hypothetical protein SDC9_167954 [bioreactor metagenome]|uniref:Uncharacterized protein n=1 Tax=bioreactor metagenome TaxID=1076179 RepID=A0A645G1R2_9ZZZZ
MSRPAKGESATFHIDVGPFQIMSGKGDFDRTVGGDAVAGAGPDAGHAAVAEPGAVVDRIGLKLHIGKHNSDPAARTELRREEHFAVTDFAETAQVGGDAQLDHHVRRRLSRTGRAASRFAVLVGNHIADVVDRAPVALVAHGNGFITLVFDRLGQVDYGHRHIQISDAAVAHGRIIAQIGALFDAAQTPAFDPEDHADDRFAFRHDLPGIHLDRRARPTFDVADADGIGAEFQRFFLDVFRRPRRIAQIHTVEIPG